MATASNSHGETIWQSHNEKRRPQWAALFVVVVLCICAIAAVLWRTVWPETWRREAYLPELEEMARHASSDGRLMALTGARQLEAHEYKSAAESLRQALAAGEDNAALRLNLAAALEASGDRARALAHLRMALQSHPAAAELQQALARIQKVPTPAPAGVLAPALCPEGPRSLIETYTKGSFLNGLSQWWGRRNPEKSGFTTRALWIIEQPENAEAQRLWGLALLKNRREIEAQAPLQKAVSLAPTSVDARVALAHWYEEAGNYSAASLQYIAALKIQRDDLSALLGLGRTSQAGGRLGNAVRSFRRATEVAPNSLEAWTGLARSYQKTGFGYDKSASAYKKAMELAPGDTSFFNDYAVSLYRLTRPDEAESLLRQQLSAAPDDALTHYLLGMVLMNARPTPERIAEAEKLTREALRLGPGNPRASAQLAQLLFQQNKETDTVLRLLRSAIRLDPYNRAPRFLLSRVYRRMGKTAMADEVAAEADALFKRQQRAADLAEKENSEQLDLKGRKELLRLYESTGDVVKARRQRDILNLLKTDPKAPARIQRSYEEAVDSVLGKAKDSMERN
jgi:Tfp pilus assembly protein PilF